ncbi:MAG: Mu transposase C-terminal domain-containing protein [Candidatus Eremiobacteraeota bacterium]|nr:Mu transposase C-terminal domain-containing protein [Candidatus Eremiobacteraeota bacterium]
MENDYTTSKALFRFQIISPLLALDLRRGEHMAMYATLSGKEWPAPDGSMVKVSPETIRLWLRLYRKYGLDGLKDAPRHQRGTSLPGNLVHLACQLKKEVPARSINKIIRIMEEMDMAPRGLLRRSTLHRVLKKAGCSARKLQLPDRKDLARWQADYANDLWQADMLEGPWLPDPDNPSRKRKTRLFAFIDDASRLALAGRFFFVQNLPALELVFKRSIQRYGCPRRCYYDNGGVFRSSHMKMICGEMGIDTPIFTKPYRPMGHGKIEAFNRFCVSDFIAEVPVSSITTLEKLNEAFELWLERDYNSRHHSELGCSPIERWHRDIERIRYADEEKLRKAFLWREERRVDKCGMISLFGTAYRVSPQFIQKKVEVRYNPEFLELVEIWNNGQFLERVAPYLLQCHRPEKAELPENSTKPPDKTTDYLGFLLNTYGKNAECETVPELFAFEEQNCAAFLDLFKEHAPPSVYEEDELRRFWMRYGPINLEEVHALLDDPTLKEHPYHHILSYLHILKGGRP